MAFTARDGKTQTVLSEINMIPFIDVVLVLLIIFMITAPVIQSGVEVHVPKTQFVREISEERLVVSITKDETIYLQSGKLLFEIEQDGVLQKREMLPGERVHITPKTVHRMTAIEDSDIFEVSTPELHDVVRIEDRYGREDKKP